MALSRRTAKRPKNSLVSPGIEVNEIDLTTVIETVDVREAAFVGRFDWGPVQQIVRVRNAKSLLNVFLTPNDVNYIDWFSAHNYLAYTNNLQLVRAFTSSMKNADSDGTGVLIKNTKDFDENYRNGNVSAGVIVARYPGVLGNSLEISMCDSANAFSSNLTALYGTTGKASVVANSAEIIFNGDVSAHLAVGDLLDAFVKANVTSTGFLEVIAVDTTDNVTTAVVNLASAVDFTANNVTVRRKWYYADLFDFAPDTSDYALARLTTNDELHAVIVDRDNALGRGENAVLARYEGLSKASDAKTENGRGNYYRTVINGNSNWVYMVNQPSHGTTWGNASANGVTFESSNKPLDYSLSGGVGSTSSITELDIQNGYDLFLNVDEVDFALMFTGAASTNTLVYLKDNIIDAREDFLTFISPPEALVVEQPDNETIVENLRTWREDTLGYSSSYLATDCGWKLQFDRWNNVYRYIPLNADLAGLCAQTDRTDAPWFSPAGFNRGAIKNCVRLAWNPTQLDRDELYKIGINPVVTFSGRGTVLYGDKTLQARKSAFDRINVRRLFLELEKTIKEASKDVLFEFNDEFTRAQFVSLVDPYLRDVQGRRGITEYRLVCDETNNTPDVVDANQFVADIFIKPARSINFIQLNFVAVKTGVSFDEIVGSL